MKTKQRAPKKTTSRANKRPAKQRKTSISAAQARRLAARHLMARMFDNAEVRDGAVVKGSYLMPGGDVWMVFPSNDLEPPSLRPSLFVVVCKRTGRVLYAGSAGDEG